MLNLRNIIQFKGRIRRRNYFILNCLFTILYLLIWEILVEGDFNNFEVTLVLILLLIVVYFSENIIIKRFHDINCSGWYSVLLLVPIVNIGGAFLLLFKEGTPGENKYGMNPKNREIVTTIAEKSDNLTDDEVV